MKRPQDVVKQLDLPDSEPNDEIFLTMVLDSFEQAPALGMDESVQHLVAFDSVGLFIVAIR